MRNDDSCGWLPMYPGNDYMCAPLFIPREPKPFSKEKQLRIYQQALENYIIVASGDKEHSCYDILYNNTKAGFCNYFDLMDINLDRLSVLKNILPSMNPYAFEAGDLWSRITALQFAIELIKTS